jgi:formylglycine-generating enzyme required for sulfatase activity
MQRFVDFHLVVNKVPGDEPGHFLTSVFEAPVTRSGSPFSWLGGARAPFEQTFPRLLGPETPIGLEMDGGGAYRLVGRGRWDDHRDLVATALFSALFPEGSPTLELLGLTANLISYLPDPDHQRQLRIWLGLAPDLANLPWELIHPPLQGRWAQDLVGLRWCVLRHMGPLRQPPRNGLHRRPVVLLVKANPSDFDDDGAIRESLEVERNGLVTAFANWSYIDLDVVEGNGTLRSLHNAMDRLVDGPRELVGLHFMGHGGVDERGAFLLGEDGEGLGMPIYSRDLIMLLSRIHSLRWVVFNACDTGYQPVGSPLAGLATAVSLLKNVPTVLAYQRPVETKTAARFAQDFYGGLLNGRGLEDIFQSLQASIHTDSGGLVILTRPCEGSLPGLEDLRQREEEPKRGVRERAPEVGREVPPPAAPLGMILVAAGTCQKGLRPEQVDLLLQRFKEHGLALDLESAREVLQQERPETALVHAFYIDRAPVTVAEFRQFVDEEKYRTTAERAGDPHNWRINDVQEKQDHPVVLVSHQDALEYCGWAKKRLPTADEWKKAFRGPHGLLYPWGDVFDKDYCNTAENLAVKETSPVTLFRDKGASPYGCLDMVGNVEEWTATEQRGNLVILGGSWAMSCEVYGLPVLHRLAEPDYYSKDQGFRCAKDA